MSLLLEKHIASISSCVDAGVKFLDEQIPNWQEKINRDVFDISHIDKCIWGQLMGCYLTARNKYGWGPKDGADMGFDFPPELVYAEDGEKYMPALQAEWLSRL